MWFWGYISDKVRANAFWTEKELFFIYFRFNMSFSTIIQDSLDFQVHIFTWNCFRLVQCKRTLQQWCNKQCKTNVRSTWYMKVLYFSVEFYSPCYRFGQNECRVQDRSYWNKNNTLQYAFWLFKRYFCRQKKCLLFLWNALTWSSVWKRITFGLSLETVSQIVSNGDSWWRHASVKGIFDLKKNTESRLFRFVYKIEKKLDLLKYI